MPKIKHIRTYPYHLPLKSSLSWGKGHRMDALRHVLVAVELSDGALGLAEATPRPTIYGETEASIHAILANEVSEIALGWEIATLADIQALDQRLGLIKNNNCAKGALNIALFSALAKSNSTRLSELLGSTSEAAQLSYIVGTGETDQVLKDVEGVCESGIRVLKVKVGKDLTREVELAQKIRSLYGDQVRFYVDANQCYTAEEAGTILETFGELGALYCEEPLPVHQLRERAALRAASPLPLIGDDSCFTRQDVMREVAFDTFDILNIKPPRTGFSASLDMLNTALVAGKEFMVGSQASSLLGAIHAVLLGCHSQVTHPTEGSFFLKVDGGGQLPLRDGMVLREDAEDMLEDIEASLLSSVA